MTQYEPCFPILLYLDELQIYDGLEIWAYTYIHTHTHTHTHACEFSGFRRGIGGSMLPAANLHRGTSQHNESLNLTILRLFHNKYFQ